MYPRSTSLVFTSLSKECPSQSITTSGLTPHSLQRVINVYGSGFRVYDSKLYYIKDCQGNVVALVGDNGIGVKIVARYIYDAWGNCKVVDN